MTYNEIDDYLEGKSVSAKAQETIESWWHKGQHKRHLPITVLMNFGSENLYRIFLVRAKKRENYEKDRYTVY